MSRLTDATNNIRNILLSRNLYTPDNQYVLNNNQIVNTLNTIATALSPFRGIDIANTALGEVAFFGSNSPIQQIGIVMLGKQFASTIASNAQRTSLPSINYSGVLNGQSIFNSNVDNTITVVAGQSTFSNLLQTLTNYTEGNNNPFLDPSKQYIENTGKGQLSHFYGGANGKSGINANMYKESDVFFLNVTKAKGFQIVNFATTTYSKLWFDPADNKNFSNAIAANSAMSRSLNGFVNQKNNQNQEYDGTEVFEINLGITDNNDADYYFPDLANNSWINSSSGGINDNINNKIVWGRDGVDKNANDVLSSMRSQTEIQLNGDRTFVENSITPNNNLDDYGATIGLLKYTSELLNASRGSFVDQTRKLFQDKEGKLVGFNGAGIWKAPPDALPNFVNKVGVRQHTALDQYDRFAKAIRFDGNYVYTGNYGSQHSVINSSVIPRITPTLKANKLDNTNLMFSIENLAVETILDPDSGIAYLNDEYATFIPMTEVGPNGCRMMWFPPYGIELNEQSNAKWQTTDFIGRSEPIYTYNGSERSANLSFKLIMDYPAQLIAFRGQADFHKRAAEFFAFGGGSTAQILNKSQIEAKLQALQAKSLALNITQPALFDNPPSLPSFEVYFPNNKPKSGEENSIFNYMYNDAQYEIVENLATSSEKGSGELNNTFGNKIYIVDDTQFHTVSGTTYKTGTTFIEQYALGTPQIAFDNLVLVLNPTMNGIKNINIILEGHASLLDRNIDTHAEYNLELSKRRITAVQNMIIQKYKAQWGKEPKDVGITFVTQPLGDQGAVTTVNGKNAATDPTTIDIEQIRQERRVTVSVKPGSKVNSVTNPKTTSTEQTNKAKIDSEILSLTQTLNSLTSELVQYNGDVFTQMGDVPAPPKGFLPIDQNVFYPAFHSQTPEDFHRRLTFLQQCLRQGPSIKRVVNGTTFSANNSAFGRPPICVLRIGDFFYTKVIIDQLTINYQESTWDLNPEGRGMQPMIAEVSLQLKVIGGQSLRGAIDALQNAVSFNYYANSTYSAGGTYATPALVEALQFGDAAGIKTLQSQQQARAADRSRINEFYYNSL